MEILLIACIHWELALELWWDKSLRLLSIYSVQWWALLVCCLGCWRSSVILSVETKSMWNLVWLKLNHPASASRVLTSWACITILGLGSIFYLFIYILNTDIIVVKLTGDNCSKYPSLFSSRVEEAALELNEFVSLGADQRQSDKGNSGSWPLIILTLQRTKLQLHLLYTLNNTYNNTYL